MKLKKLIPAVIALTLTLTYAISGAFAFDEEDYATRGEVAETLISAADDYNPGVEKTEVIKGYGGELFEERAATRAETLVMLSRAFGGLPEPDGYNAEIAILSGGFTDVPVWAAAELEDAFEAGIVAGTSEGIFSPDEPVTKEQLELFIRRVYSLYGSNEKDDFYAAVNKETLNGIELKPGRVIAGTIYDLNDRATEQIKGIIKEIVSKPHPKGGAEQKIADYYKSITDIEARNMAGISPIKEYLDLIEGADTIDDLVGVQNTLQKELCVSPFMGFSLDVDDMDSSRYALVFKTAEPTFTEADYEDISGAAASAYLRYGETVFKLIGENESAAAIMARQCFELEKILAGAKMDQDAYSDVDKTYNVFTLREIKDMFGGIDIDSVLGASGFEASDKIIINDVGLTKAFAGYFRDETLDALKAYAKQRLALMYGPTLNREFDEASDQFTKDYLGVEDAYTDEETAIMLVKGSMPEYIGRLYSERYFSEEAKREVENMVQDILEVYRRRLENNSWLSETTKERALRKLDALGVKVGYPDSWESPLDGAEITPPEEGGSYFENQINIKKAYRRSEIEKQNRPVDKSDWALSAFMVNAYYTPESNDITFPAAILQAPLYDVSASYEENLGGIGFIIAHEITHAFDNNGAKYDENGNAADWWEPEDYDEFQRLCGEMIEFYDGWEGVPGIPVDGTLTLSENVADQGALQCITEIAAGLEDPDLKRLYTSFAHCWATVTTREYSDMRSKIDYHSDEKLRVNRTVVNCGEFYEVFRVEEGDGMYVNPEDRLQIW